MDFHTSKSGNHGHYSLVIYNSAGCEIYVRLHFKLFANFMRPDCLRFECIPTLICGPASRPSNMLEARSN